MVARDSALVVLGLATMPGTKPSSAVTKNALWDNNTRCALFATGMFGRAKRKKYSVYSGALMGIRNRQPNHTLLLIIASRPRSEDRVIRLESQTGYGIITN